MRTVRAECTECMRELRRVRELLRRRRRRFGALALRERRRRRRFGALALRERRRRRVRPIAPDLPAFLRAAQRRFMARDRFDDFFRFAIVALLLRARRPRFVLDELFPARRAFRYRASADGWRLRRPLTFLARRAF